MEEFENKLNIIINNQDISDVEKSIEMKRTLDELPEEVLIENVINIIHEILSVKIDNKKIMLEAITERLSDKELSEKIEPILTSIFSIDENVLSSKRKEMYVEDILKLLNNKDLEEKLDGILNIIVNVDEDKFAGINKKVLIIDIVEKLSDDILQERIEKILELILNSSKISKWEKELIFNEVVKNLPQEVLENKIENIINIIINAKNEILLDFDKGYIIKAIIRNLPQKHLEENLKKILELNQGKYDIYSAIIEKAIEYRKTTLLKEIPEEKLIEYVNSTTLPAWADMIEDILKDETSIVQNDFLIQILNLTQNSTENRTDEERKKIEKIKSEFEKTTSSYAMPNMELFDDKVSNFEEMSEDEFEEFVKNIEILKIKTGRIPEKYCDYLIKQKLVLGKNKEGDIYSGIKVEEKADKYLCIFKRAFEDKTLHILERNGIFGYKVVFAELNGDTVGEQSAYSKTIKYKLDKLISLNIEETGLINTMFHEIEHAKQNASIISRDIERIDGIKYNIIKEKFVKKEDIGFYNSNYQRMYEEIGARIEGSKEQSKYLEYLGFSPEQIILSDKTKLKECFEKVREIESQNLEKAQNKVGKDAEIISIPQKFMEILAKKSPSEIRKILEEYPALQLEYGEDGKRKTVATMFEEINNKKLSEAEINIYMEIFRENVQLDFETAVNDLRTIIQYKNYTSIDVTLMDNFIEQIVKNEIFITINANHNLENFNNFVTILSEFATENPELSVSSWILEQIEEYKKTGLQKQENNVAKEDEILKQIVDKRKKVIYLSRPTIETLEEFESIIDEIVLQDFSFFDLGDLVERLLKDKINYSNVRKEDIIAYILKAPQIDSFYKRKFVNYLTKNMSAEEKNVEVLVKIILNIDEQNLDKFIKRDIIVNIIKDMTIEEQEEKVEVIFDIILNFDEKLLDSFYKEMILMNINDILEPEFIERNPSLKEKINNLEKMKERRVKTINYNYVDKINSINDFQSMLKELNDVGADLWYLQKTISDFVTRKIDYNKVDVVDIIKAIYEIQILNAKRYTRTSCITNIIINLPVEIQKEKLKETLEVIRQNENKDDGKLIIEDILNKLREKNVNVDDVLYDRKDNNNGR